MFTLISSLLFAVSTTSTAVPLPVSTPLIKEVAITVEKIDYATEAQSIYLEKLLGCESAGSTTVKVLDTNSRYSYGKYQFQMATWLGQSEHYKLDYKEEDIFDGDKQRYLAHLMLSDGGMRHWYVCTRPLGSFPQN